MNTEKSKLLYKQACALMPGGVNSPVRACAAVDATPLFIEKANGSRIYDADGNEYIDYVCSWGPAILGHSCPQTVAAVKDACENGLTFGACHKGEIELARTIREHMPSMQRVRLVNSGTEAVMSAVRAARGYTHRDKIVKLEGCYHGHSDGLLAKAGSGLMTGSVPDSAGVPASCTQDTLLAKYNDEHSVKELFDRYKNDIAAVIAEPCAANMGVVPPKEGFLEFLRDVTKTYGALLIFDEVITGFRLSIGGAQALYGVTPDLTTLGKIVGGGMPLAAYGGREDIMSVVAPVGSVYQAGTLSGNPVAVAAGLATLQAIERQGDALYKELDRKGAKIEAAMKAQGITVNRAGSLITPFFTHTPVTDYATARTCDTKRYAQFYRHMLSKGVYLAPSQFEAMFVSAAHSEEDIEYTAKCIQECVPPEEA